MKKEQTIEYLDIVDADDLVIGKASKEEVYRQKLRHRIAHVLVFNDEEEIVLQLRSNSRSFCPGHWVTSAGGHVQAGETYEQGALREYEEELGVRSELEFLGKESYVADGTPEKFLGIYKSRHNGPFAIDTDAVERVEFFSLPKVWAMIEAGEKFHPELLFILDKYFH